jgi:hypothetical protein
MHRVLALALALVILPACSRSTCKRAAARMVECRTMVGHLGTDPNNLSEHQGIAQLEGACEVAAQSDPEKAKLMACVADAPSCDALAECAH